MQEHHYFLPCFWYDLPELCAPSAFPPHLVQTQFFTWKHQLVRHSGKLHIGPCGCTILWWWWYLGERGRTARATEAFKQIANWAEMQQQQQEENAPKKMEMGADSDPDKWVQAAAVNGVNQKFSLGVLGLLSNFGIYISQGASGLVHFACPLFEHSCPRIGFILQPL